MLIPKVSPAIPPGAPTPETSAITLAKAIKTPVSGFITSILSAIKLVILENASISGVIMGII